MWGPLVWGPAARRHVGEDWGELLRAHWVDSGREYEGGGELKGCRNTLNWVSRQGSQLSDRARAAPLCPASPDQQLSETPLGFSPSLFSPPQRAQSCAH